MTATPRLRPLALAILAAGAALAGLAVALGWGVAARAAIVAGTCVTLWLLEAAPTWVPTLVLWTATPLLLAGADPAFLPHRVLAWSADPVLVLFLGGFALAAAAERQGVDRLLVARTLRLAGGRATRVVALAAGATALLSMWMSNIAAAALMLGAFRSVWGDEAVDGRVRRALLLAIALAADVGGIATPIGTGPNGIALAAAARTQPIGFVQWMAFGVPLAAGLLAASLALVVVWLRPHGAVAIPPAPPVARMPGLARLGATFGIVVLLWLTEPLHGVRAWIVAGAAVLALALLGLLGARELRRVDWGTLVLIAGGIALGTLLERAGVVARIAERLALDALPPTVALLVLCLVCALASALMSNTATATFLIPLAAATVDATPSTAIIVAIAASMGVPFVVSTPPNAMAVAGGLPARDLLGPGLLLMLGGCVLVALTGRAVLAAVGVP
jgi:sodium-dependent dicarboxylate transporter 2/3/5